MYLVEVDEIWLNFDSLTKESSSSRTFALCEVRNVLSVDPFYDTAELSNGVVVAVVYCVKGSRKNVSTAAHFLGRENVDKFAIILDVVSLSHLAKSHLDDLLVFISLYSFNWQLTAGEPAKSEAHYAALSKVLLFLFSAHF